MKEFSVKGRGCLSCSIWKKNKQWGENPAALSSWSPECLCLYIALHTLPSITASSTMCTSGCVFLPCWFGFWWWKRNWLPLQMPWNMFPDACDRIKEWMNFFVHLCASGKRDNVHPYMFICKYECLKLCVFLHMKYKYINACCPYDLTQVLPSTEGTRMNSHPWFFFNYSWVVSKYTQTSSQMYGVVFCVSVDHGC